MKDLTMKKTIVLFALLLSNIALAQSPAPDGFWGVKWGTAIAETKKIVLSKPGVKFSKSTDGDALIFENGTWGAFKPSLSVFVHGDEGMHTGKVVIEPSLEAKVFEMYDDVVRELTSKYGAPKHVFKNFTKPYEEGDGYELSAVKLGKATYSTYWMLGDKDSILICTEITESASVRVTYQNAVLSGKANEKVKKSNQSEY